MIAAISYSNKIAAESMRTVTVEPLSGPTEMVVANDATVQNSVITFRWMTRQ